MAHHALLSVFLTESKIKNVVKSVQLNGKIWVLLGNRKVRARRYRQMTFDMKEINRVKVAVRASKPIQLVAAMAEMINKNKKL